MQDESEAREGEGRATVSDIAAYDEKVTSFSAMTTKVSATPNDVCQTRGKGGAMQKCTMRADGENTVQIGELRS